ncbi:carboxypeptidase regulatory-like domain-containing protein [Paenibacillus sp. ClWae2A]|uniref:carboxypeptidase-like regulatory domain-containing protein n=1 Tax=Paenibacillus sp. ClWae2A TaxID=3057177 RepID=UPI0028F4D303|nr:carboxypeptidase regulatory-like domain-containing protein [Paenibacillus sp. ClWae2A]MDT9718772.1 carboxypeptidase regulatory-like domain-containing protein [Paenibacillus sp. ClWae2A]
MSNRSPWMVRFVMFFLVSVLFSVVHTGTASAAKENTVVKLSSTDHLDFYIYEPSIMVGTVTDDEGNPVAGAVVKVTGLYDKPVKTNQRGIYTVTGIDYDYNPNIAIWIDKEEYVPYVQDRLGISPGVTRKLNVILEKAAHVRGKVVDENGRPIAAAKVSVNGEAVTDARGDYLVSGCIHQL